MFFRYRFEDVRLFKINSLLIRDLLVPDARIRTSGFGANFVFDTRRNCNIKYTILDVIAKGDPGDPCRYNPGDPTRGNYITAEYSFSLPALGANIGFHKFQGSYNTYVKSNKWWLRLFFFLLDLGLVNCYIIAKILNPTLSHSCLPSDTFPI